MTIPGNWRGCKSGRWHSCRTYTGAPSLEVSREPCFLSDSSIFTIELRKQIVRDDKGDVKERHTQRDIRDGRAR